MYRPQRTRPNPSSTAAASAARLAAEAAFAAPPFPERTPDSTPTALVVVKKKRAIDPSVLVGEHAHDGPHDGAGHPHDDPHPEHDGHHAPRVFRVATAPVATADKPAEPHDEAPAPHVHHAARRLRRHAATRPSPVVTIVAPSSPPVDLAALSRDLEAAMTAREHAAAEAQLSRLQAQLRKLDSVLALIAKARDFNLSDTQLSTQWQQLTQAAARLLEGLSVSSQRLSPQV